MDQTNRRGNFRTNESMFKQFRQSCLGKVVITGVIIIILLIVAAITNPSAEKMVSETIDNVHQSIESDLGRDAEWIEATVSNIGYTFSSADPDEALSKGQKERRKIQWEAFNAGSYNQFNESNVSNYTFFSTISIPNNIFGEPKVVGFGIFGLVIPTVNYNNFIPLDGKTGDRPGQKIDNGVNPDEYMGDNPELGPFRNMYGE